MRYRVNIRDIFWYRKAQSVGDRVFEASPFFRQSPPPNESGRTEQSTSKVSHSVLDTWEKRVLKMFGKSQSDKVGFFSVHTYTTEIRTHN